MGKYPIEDYTIKYGSIMQFGKNKNTYIHGWYPFVEGYSKEFICKIISEYKDIYHKMPKVCLEPFCGSGTTPLELQKMDIECYSFEVSPFMFNLSKTKLNTEYTIFDYVANLNKIKVELTKHRDYDYQVLYKDFKTIVEKEGMKKWNFNRVVMDGILDIKNSIDTLYDENYKNLFTIALASILLEVSNVYRNGKCISYKKNWEDTIKYTRDNVHEIFLEKLDEIFYPDIVKLNQYKSEKLLISNGKYCYFGDCRKLIDSEISNDTIDLIITSPPYLNSRDYTDTYIVELRVLGYLPNREAVRNLRKNTIRSHVQINWEETKILDIQQLKDTLDELSLYKKEFWNKSLLEMIAGYFEDMDILFRNLYNKMTENGLIWCFWFRQIVKYY